MGLRGFFCHFLYITFLRADQQGQFDLFCEIILVPGDCVPIHFQISDPSPCY